MPYISTAAGAGEAMFNLWAYSILILSVIVMAISWRVPRAWLWILALMADFIATSLFWDYGNHAFHPLFTLACDASVCLACHVYAQEKWELGFFLAFLSSVFISLLKLSGLIPNSVIYASFLEVFNYCALILIGGMGILDMISRHDGHYLRPLSRRLHSARNTL